MPLTAAFTEYTGKKVRKAQENRASVRAGKAEPVQRAGETRRCGPEQAEGAGTMKMKKQLDIKKLLLLNMPYILMGLFATNFGEGMADGRGCGRFGKKCFRSSPRCRWRWPAGGPACHPLDLLVGLCCGAGLRLAVYLKSKNAKKYRHGMELWQRPLECIILSVKGHLHGRTGGYAHD